MSMRSRAGELRQLGLGQRSGRARAQRRAVDRRADVGQPRDEPRDRQREIAARAGPRAPSAPQAPRRAARRRRRPRDTRSGASEASEPAATTRAPSERARRDHFAARLAHPARGTSCSGSCSCPRRTRRPAGRAASQLGVIVLDSRRQHGVEDGDVVARRAQQRGDLQRRERRIRFRALALLLVETQEIGMADEYRQQREPLADTGTSICVLPQAVWFYARGRAPRARCAPGARVYGGARNRHSDPRMDSSRPLRDAPDRSYVRKLERFARFAEPELKRIFADLALPPGTVALDLGLRRGSRDALVARAASATAMSSASTSRCRTCRQRGAHHAPLVQADGSRPLLSRRHVRLHLGLQHGQPPGRPRRSAAGLPSIAAPRRPARARAERLPARHVLRLGRAARGRRARGLPSRLSRTVRARRSTIRQAFAGSCASWPRRASRR